MQIFINQKLNYKYNYNQLKKKVIDLIACQQKTAEKPKQ